MTSKASFAVDCPDDRRCETLVLGLSNLGFAGVTATDYLSGHLECEEIGHVSSADLPTITPFAEGTPRHHTRVYDVVETPLALVVGELFVPVGSAAAFVDALLEWTAGAGVEEIVVPYGIPYPHGPDEHAVFHVATDEFREQRLVDLDIDGLGGGVLDGVVGELLARSLDGPAPPTGALVTPIHPPGPDLEATLLLVDALESAYGIDVDEDELRQRSAELRRYYAAMADRLNAVDEGRDSRDYPVDRSYM